MDEPGVEQRVVVLVQGDVAVAGDEYEVDVDYAVAALALEEAEGALIRDYQRVRLHGAPLVTRCDRCRRLHRLQRRHVRLDDAALTGRVRPLVPDVVSAYVSVAD